MPVLVRILIVVAVLTGSPALADRCHLDPVPAATLLLPYFEVDLEDPSGPTTLFSVTNARSAPTVAHVTMWTDWGVPVLDFDLFLTGYDVVTVNLRDVFVGGLLPRTADASQDPNDSISPHGLPEWDGAVGCEGFLPYSDPGVPILSSYLKEYFQAAFTGQALPDGSAECVGEDHGDARARGFLTIDNAVRCGLGFPTSPGYFDAEGIASRENALLGDFFLVDAGRDLAQGETMVHLEMLEADEEGPTFYGSLLGGADTDRREPLPHAFGVRYLSGGAIDTTDLLVWRDPLATERVAVPCDESPSWEPLWQRSILVFDEEESFTAVCEGCPVCSPPFTEYCFPLATQRLPIDSPFDVGWAQLDLRFADSISSHPDQAWVLPLHSAEGRFSVGHGAYVLRTLCDDDDPEL